MGGGASQSSSLIVRKGGGVPVCVDTAAAESTYPAEDGGEARKGVGACDEHVRRCQRHKHLLLGQLVAVQLGVEGQGQG